MKSLFLATVITATLAFGAERPNVLFIAIDDLNTSPDLFQGETTVKTPNMNRLAQKGVTFMNAHCAAPACNPSRASVMTGIAPARSGVYANTQDWRENKLLWNSTSLPQHFKNHGYETLGGGKLYHASTLSEHMYEGYIDPRPWDAYFPSKNCQMPKEVCPPHIPMNGNPAFYGGYMDWAVLDIEPDEMADAKVVAWASEQLSRVHDKPLFLGVGIYRPHIPWYTPNKYYDQHPLEEVVLPEVVPNDLADVPEAGKKQLKREWQDWFVANDKWKPAVQAYNASVRFADDMVGRLLTALENGPLADNTVIVLWTDHGYHLGQKEHWEKFALWEQTTRVPLIIAAPGQFKVGQASRQAVSLLDLYPTLNELCGIPSSEKLSGESLVPLLKNPDLETGRAVVTTQLLNNHAVRSDAWRYIRYADGSEELYNQKLDPKNFINLATYPEYDSVKKELATWLPTENAPKNPTHNAQRDPKKQTH